MGPQSEIVKSLSLCSEKNVKGMSSNNFALFLLLNKSGTENRIGNYWQTSVLRSRVENIMQSHFSIWESWCTVKLHLNLQVTTQIIREHLHLAELFPYWCFFETNLEIFICRYSMKMFYTENLYSEVLYLSIYLYNHTDNFEKHNFLIEYFRHVLYTALIINASKH